MNKELDFIDNYAPAQNLQVEFQLAGNNAYGNRPRNTARTVEEDGLEFVEQLKRQYPDAPPESFVIVGEVDPQAPPVLTLPQAMSQALEALRLKKWEMKEAGIAINGISIDTDKNGQDTLSGAMLNCVVNPDYKAYWKTAAVDAEGKAVWVELDASLIKALCQAMTAYTQTCFNVEAAKQDELVALQSAEAIDEWLADELDKGWPDRTITLG